MKQSVFHIIITVIISVLSITQVQARAGDTLVITGNIVNLRTGPSTNTDVAIKLLKDRKVKEIQRQDDWVEVETGRTDIKSGWVHRSLLKVIKQRLSLAQKRFVRFNEHFTQYKETMKQTGAEYFLEAKDKGEGTLEIVVTKAWLNANDEKKQHSLNKVFQLWSAVIPVGSAMSVHVIDRNGEQHSVILR